MDRSLALMRMEESRLETIITCDIYVTVLWQAASRLYPQNSNL